MKNIEERAKLDKYEMKKHYDFSESTRGRFYNPKKVQTTLPLDSDILLFIKKQAREQHIDYSLLVNTLLRDYMNNFVRKHPQHR
jgi:predicted DNA binding CopG/RHH family protein